MASASAPFACAASIADWCSLSNCSIASARGPGRCSSAWRCSRWCSGLSCVSPRMTCVARAARAYTSSAETNRAARASQMSPGAGTCAQPPTSAAATSAHLTVKSAPFMFDFAQKHRRILQVFLGLIAITFATWGIESYTRYAGGRDTVASVNGSEISQREFSQQLQQQQEQLRRMFGGRLDPAMLDTPEARRAVLDQMIAQRLVAIEAAKRNLFMSREAVIEAITTAPEFQESGKFSPALYSAYLAQRGMTDKGNVQQLQAELPLTRFVSSIGETAIVSRAVAARLAALEAQQREVSEARIPAQQFLGQVKVTDAQVKEYYEQNAAQFRTPERVRAEYVMLSADALAKQDPPTEDEIKKAYEARATAFRVEEQRRASHILVKTKEEADKIAAEVKANPNRFADLAKKQSTDPGSAEK